jgi:starch-binding outer membrane protein, SusD/RagB family
MKRIIPILILIVLGISCQQDILDTEPQNIIAESAVWEDADLIRAYHADLYNAIPHGFYIHMYSKYTDEAYNSAPCCCAEHFKLHTYSPDNIAQVGGDWCGNFLYFWDRGYQFNRRINVFLQKMEEEVDIEMEDKDRLIAEAKFLRAYIYFELIKRFGGVPIVEEAYGLDDAEQVKFERNTFDECVAFIEQNISEAMPNLDDRYLSTDAKYGRATRDAAQALLSRTYLYAASPLFNSTNDLQKWQKAATAAEALLNRGYTLYPDYQKLFELSQGDPQDEVIFSRGFTATPANGHQAPMHNFNRRYEGYGGWWGSNGPSQNLVDDYDMTNGEPPFLADGSINPLSGYNPQNPFANRDPRFDATIIHDGSEFRGDTYEMWIAESGPERGFDSYKNTGDNPRTNYVLKKFMPSEGAFNWSTFFTNQWPHFRLAEIYLNYAEAKFELGDEATAREYLNKVRKRASVNLPDIPATVTGAELRRRIYKERRVELAFESHRFFDVRRWKISSDIENRPITTLDIFKDMSTGVKRYEKVILLDRTGKFQEKMNLLPIAQDEIQRNPKLAQTAGWGQL